jgi:protocatechuate 3,4-dioxygenase beta subunit
MAKKQRHIIRVRRRDALKGLGALAISAPTFAAIGCSGAGASDPLAQSAAGGGAPAGAASPATGNAAAASGGAAGQSAHNSGGASGMTNAAKVPQGGASGMTASATPSAGAGSSAQAGSHAAVSGSGGRTGAAGTSAGSAATSAMFDDAASCTLTTTDIEGPFYIDDAEIPNDISLVRSDVRENLSGVEFRLSFRMLDAKNKCAAIPGAELYIWHCNADGYYSGFDGQDPSKPYTGSADPAPVNLDRFCRGIQTSDGDGIASFVTLYPGWYAGRPIHIHLMARFPGMTKRLITTQLYFPAAFTKEVHTSEPAYMARAASIPAGSLNPPTGKPAIPTLKHTAGLVIGTLNVIVNRA